jgi:hypothetical protein
MKSAFIVKNLYRELASKGCVKVSPQSSQSLDEPSFHVKCKKAG